MAYRRQNPIHQMPQRAVLCSPSYEVQYVLMNPGGQMEAAWLQGASGGEGREQTGSRDSLVLRRLVLSHEHCSPSLQAGVGNRGVPEKAFGAMQTEGPPRDSGHPPLLRPRPTKRKPERRRRLPRAWKSRTGKNVTRPVCPCRTALLAMCKSHAGTAPLHPPQPPFRKSPPRRPRGPPLPGTERPLTPYVTSPAGPAAGEPAAACPHPGVADANFREQKSCLQTMRELRGEPGRPGPGARRLRRCRSQGSS